MTGAHTGTAAPRAGVTPEPIPYRRIAAVMGVIGAYSLTIGYTYPAIAYAMEANGHSPGIIGATASMSGVGLVLGSILAPWLAMRFGAWPTAAGALAATLVAHQSFLRVNRRSSPTGRQPACPEPTAGGLRVSNAKPLPDYRAVSETLRGCLDVD